MQILGLETSCDETGIAVFDTEKGLTAHAVYSQIDLHALYGGVVPELASRDHVRRLVPLVRKTLSDAGIALKNLDGLAYTAGPGLSGALMTGSVFARSVGWALGLPTIGVHHLEGHLLAPLLEPDPPEFPCVCLLVSGGHTMLIHVEDIGVYRLLGESIDDAAGEAFDKTAKMLGLPYPGGPHLAKLAENGDATRYSLPRPMTDRPGFDFSFSGLKTAAITTFRGKAMTEQDSADIAASFQAAVVDTLLIKSQRAVQAEGVNQLVVSGGVSANRSLRDRFREVFDQAGVKVAYPRLEFCTDNGAMIALAGGIRLKAGLCDAADPLVPDGLSASIRPRWPLDSLPLLPASSESRA